VHKDEFRDVQVVKLTNFS